VCTLKEHDFDEAIPKFTALSYTWGSQEDPKTILLDGREATITSNLHAALTHLRQSESKEVLWIDALCINQQDVKERNQQVRLMRDIYMVAEGVLAWLGPATPDLDPEDGSAVYKDMISRQYWTRVWIIQEFILGRNVVLQCGHVLYDWDKLNNSFPSRHDRRGGEKLHRLFDLKRRLGPNVKALPASEAFRFAHESEATDPRDKIYGVLGLIHMRHGLAPPDNLSRTRQKNLQRMIVENSIDGVLWPDYRLSLCHVFSQAIKILRLECSSLTHINRAMQEQALEKQQAFKGRHAKRCDGVACGTEERFRLILGLNQ
jgi:hypothetical protein